MVTDKDTNPWGSAYRRPQSLMQQYAAAVAYIAVTNQSGDEAIGTAFHVGGGVLITARHVVHDCRINEIGQSESCVNLPDIWYTREGNHAHGSRGDKSSLIRGPLYHPDPNVDVAVVVLEGLEKPIIPLGSHLDDWLDNSLTLTEAIVMGYPPIPFARGPLLITARAEVNAIVDLRSNNPHPRFVLSSMARGGFSGGPAISCYDFALGVITDSLSYNHAATELGYMAAITIEPILDTLGFHHISPPGVYPSWVLYGGEEPFDEEE